MIATWQTRRPAETLVTRQRRVAGAPGAPGAVRPRSDSRDPSQSASCSRACVCACPGGVLVRAGWTGPDSGTDARAMRIGTFRALRGLRIASGCGKCYLCSLGALIERDERVHCEVEHRAGWKPEICKVRWVFCVLFVCFANLAVLYRRQC